MRGIPQELLVLIVGLALLVQFLYERWRRGVARSRTTTETATASLAVPRPPKAILLAAEPAPPPRAIEELRPTQAIPAPRALLRAWDRPRRFSRTALLPDRRAVQNAVVIATILRPCHAHRPHGVE